MVSEIIAALSWGGGGSTPNSISSPHYCTGYVTTNEKYVLLLEDSIESTQLQKARDNETCILMVCICISSCGISDCKINNTPYFSLVQYSPPVYGKLTESIYIASLQNNIEAL